MPGDPLKKVKPGDKLRIPAPAYNAFIDAAMDLRARQHNQGQTPQPAHPRSSGIVRVKNASGYDQVRFAVLGVAAPIFTPADNLNSFKNEVALVGVVPTVQAHYGRFIVLLEPLKAGAIGMAYAAGVCPIKVNIVDAAHNYADVTPADTTILTSGTFGTAQILWKETGTGTKWAVVRLGASAAKSLTPVTLTYDSGDDGTATTAPTYIYKNPMDLVTGVEILKADGSHYTGQSPRVGRQIGSFSHATDGLVYFDSAGILQLYRAYEAEAVCE